MNTNAQTHISHNRYIPSSSYSVNPVFPVYVKTQPPPDLDLEVVKTCMDAIYTGLGSNEVKE